MAIAGNAFPCTIRVKVFLHNLEYVISSFQKHSGTLMYNTRLCLKKGGCIDINIKHFYFYLFSFLRIMIVRNHFYFSIEPRHRIHCKENVFYHEFINVCVRITPHDILLQLLSKQKITLYSCVDPVFIMLVVIHLYYVCRCVISLLLISRRLNQTKSVTCRAMRLCRSNMHSIFFAGHYPACKLPKSININQHYFPWVHHGVYTVAF